MLRNAAECCEVQCSAVECFFYNSRVDNAKPKQTISKMHRLAAEWCAVVASLRCPMKTRVCVASGQPLDLADTCPACRLVVLLSSAVPSALRVNLRLLPSQTDPPTHRPTDCCSATYDDEQLAIMYREIYYTVPYSSILYITVL